MILITPSVQMFPLDCHFEAYPLPLTFWMKETLSDGFPSSSIVGDDGAWKGGRFPSKEGPVEPNERISSVIREKSYRHHLRLIITSIQSSDYGVYKCMAKNEYGTQEGLITLFGEGEL